jgi:tetratricopeptide (TPR) repeat protein/transcriptional regulator with XRE-family HTH domain
VAERPVTLAELLRKLRTEAGLTQEELASAARLSSRSISDLERGVNLTARKDTARLLADALHLTGPPREQFEAVARGRTLAGGQAATDAASGLGAGIAATRTLPRDIASFTGREPELRELVDVVASATGSGGVVGIHAIGGMAGVGKTAFAVHAAHQLASRFPGGQIFLPLHGHTPGQRPVDPADALANLLMTVGVPVQQIPPDLEARIALWRDRLVGRQLLLVLDDAADSEQVRPLLPGTSASLVLVTSRRHLSALEDTRAISLDTLPPKEAAELLVRLAARPRLSPFDMAVAEVTRLCGYLPLAVGMLARQLHHHPAWTLEDLAADLAAARDRLELMQAENLSVTAAFNLSYEDLTGAQRQLFRRLGLHPGTDIDAHAAAALSDNDLALTRRHLEALYDHYLLTEPTRGRYRLHDLIREHAHALNARDDPDGDRDQAISRLMDYYQYTAGTAGEHITRCTRPGSVAVEVTPAEVPNLPDSTQALRWMRAERANLLACLDHATRGHHQHARVVTLTAVLTPLLRHDGPWTDALSRHTVAVHAARQLNDRLSEANALIDWGDMRRLTGDRPGAVENFEAALQIYRDLGNGLGQTNARYNLGEVWRLTGDYSDAVRTLEEALGIARSIGDLRGQANALRELGIVRQLTDDYPSAELALEAALSISRNIGDRLAQAIALRNLGIVRWLTGDYPGAAEALEEGMDIARNLGDRLGFGNALAHLGVVRRLTGDYPGAAEVLQEALLVYREIGDRLGQANALSSLGTVRRLTRDYPEAAEDLALSLSIYRDLDDRGGEIEVLNETGTLHQIRGALSQARECHRQALGMARELNSSRDEANALAGLARCALAADLAAEAETALEEALGIFERIGATEAADVAAELDAVRAARRSAAGGAVG